MTDVSPASETSRAWWLQTFVTFVISASATAPVAAAIQYVELGGFQGWAGSPIEQILGWALLSAPYLLFFGTPVAFGVGFVLRPAARAAGPFRIVPIGLALVADAVFSLAILLPNNMTIAQAVGTWTAYLATWMVFVLGLALMRKR